MSELFPMSSELTELAHRLGNHPARLAIWNEGAVAATLPSGRMVDSAAGANLGRLDARSMVELDLPTIQGFLGKDDVAAEDFAAALTDSESAIPTADVYTFADLFAFEGVRFAAHTQPISVNQLICSPRARQFADRRNLPHEIIACGQASVLVPFAPPGLPLAREVKRKIALWRDRFKIIPKLILIQNHGMITLGDTVEEILMLTEMTMKYAEIFLGAAMMGGPEFMKPNHVTQIEATRVV